MSNSNNKVIVLCKRMPEMSMTEYREWFLDPHATGAASAIGHLVDRYSVSFVNEPGPQSSWPPGDPPFDVVSELWVKDAETLKEAYDVLSRRRQMHGVIDRSAVRWSMVTEEHVIV